MVAAEDLADRISAMLTKDIRGAQVSSRLWW